ncbi:MAG: enoyl-CoA hydratase-related protein [Sulfitobacter sp.]
MIAAVNGVAAGGGVGIALGRDIVLASQKAAFAMPFVPGLGIVPDCRASWLFTRKIGAGRALPAIVLGDTLAICKVCRLGAGEGGDHAG